MADDHSEVPRVAPSAFPFPSERRAREFPRNRAGGAPPLDMEALLKPSSALTPREAVQAVFDALRLLPDPALEDAVADEIKGDRVRYGAWQREASRFSGVAPSGLGPDPFNFRTAQSIVEAAREGSTSRLAYLNSNIGKARRKIAEGARKAGAIHAALDRVGAGLSRGDGSAPKFAEEARDLVQDLRIVLADVEAFVTLATDEADAQPGPEAA